MSLFLQTLVLRGILFREQEHRQERIGVGMTLWPTGPTRGEETNDDNQWTLLFSEQLGHQRWQESPPIANG